MPKKTIHITIDPKLHREIKAAARKSKKSVSLFISEGAKHEIEALNMSQVRE